MRIEQAVVGKPVRVLSNHDSGRGEIIAVDDVGDIRVRCDCGHMAWYAPEEVQLLEDDHEHERSPVPTTHVEARCDAFVRSAFRGLRSMVRVSEVTVPVAHEKLIGPHEVFEISFQPRCIFRPRHFLVTCLGSPVVRRITLGNTVVFGEPRYRGDVTEMSVWDLHRNSSLLMPTMRLGTTGRVRVFNPSSASISLSMYVEGKGVEEA